MAGVSRRQFLATATAGVGVATLGCRRGRSPNVVFILTDDQRWDCLSCAGHPFLKTPNLDRLAAEGVRFANAFCPTSLCSPSRASFLSGLYAHTHGVSNNFTEYPDNLPSYPKALKAAGYQTAYIGKWHMGENNDEPRSGFDYWASHKGQGQYYDTTFNINGTRQPTKGYYTHTVTNLATDWLKTARRPFALEVGHKAPHGLWVAEPKYARAFDDVVFKKPATAVPGAGTPDWVRRRMKTWHGIDGPLYGAGSYDTFVRTYLQTILSVDDSVGVIYDTLKMDYCGAAPQSTQGRSFRPLLEGRPASWRTSFLYEYNFETEFPYTPNVRAVRTRDWKYIHYPNGAGQPDTEMAELYNLALDPIEAHNLIAVPEAQSTLAELRTELARLLRQTGADPDRMPVNPQLRFELPDAAIR